MTALKHMSLMYYDFDCNDVRQPRVRVSKMNIAVEWYDSDFEYWWWDFIGTILRR